MLGLSLSLVLCANSSAPSPDVSTFDYRFRSNQDLEAFQVLAGSWRIHAGSLRCTSKGEQDGLLWRRQLSAEGQVDFVVDSGRRVGLRLFSESDEIRFELEPRSGVLEVFRRGEKLRTAYVEKPDRDWPIAVAFGPGEVQVTVGEDNPVRVLLNPLAAERWSVALLSFAGHASFSRLMFRREDSGSASALRNDSLEQRRILREDAERLIAARRYDSALQSLLRIAAEQGSAAPADLFQSSELLLLNQIAAAGLRDVEPLGTLLDQARSVTGDGTVEFLLPFRREWLVEFPEVRRTDGILARIACSSPPVRMEVQRYDQRFQYWFGKDPNFYSVSGSSKDALARARLDQHQLDLAATALGKPERPSRRIDGETAIRFEVRYQKDLPGENLPANALQEWFVSFRGDTYQLSVEGSAEALERTRFEVDWILDSLRFHRRNEHE